MLLEAWWWFTGPPFQNGELPMTPFTVVETIIEYMGIEKPLAVELFMRFSS